jgi:hypothetical protein
MRRFALGCAVFTFALFAVAQEKKLGGGKQVAVTDSKIQKQV